MRTATHRTRQGVATRLVTHVLDEARGRGLHEDQPGDRRRRTSSLRLAALYARHGFDYCEPFADYRLDPLSVFMTRSL